MSNVHSPITIEDRPAQPNDPWQIEPENATTIEAGLDDEWRDGERSIERDGESDGEAASVVSPNSPPANPAAALGPRNRFAPHHLDYMRARAIDPELAWKEGVRSLDEAEAQRHSRCRDIVG